MCPAAVGVCFVVLLQKFTQDCVDMAICNHVDDTVDELINHSDLFYNNTDASGE